MCVAYHSNIKTIKNSKTKRNTRTLTIFHSSYLMNAGQKILLLIFSLFSTSLSISAKMFSSSSSCVLLRSVCIKIGTLGMSASSSSIQWIRRTRNCEKRGRSKQARPILTRPILFLSRRGRKKKESSALDLSGIPVGANWVCLFPWCVRAFVCAFGRGCLPESLQLLWNR